MRDQAADEQARDELVVLWVSDRERGLVRSEDEYRGLFPGHEDVVTAELRRLEKQFSEGRVVFDAAASPREREQHVLGRYRIEAELGKGAQGTVYLATDTQLGRRVALKVLDVAWSRSSAVVTRFVREARALARLSHPGIAAIHDTGSSQGLEYFAMDYVEGRTLAAGIAARASRGDAPDAAAVARDIALVEKCARALHVAHEAGLVHRDVKPGNVMVTPAGEPVVLDFGVARMLDPDATRLTVTGDVMGTPDFMAPEQITGDARGVDRRADVFALAAVLRVLTGGQSIPRNLSAVLAVASDPDPDRRYATAAAFADDLARVRRGDPVAVRPPGAVRKLARWARQAPASAALAILPPVALLAGVIALSAKNEEIGAAARALHVREGEAKAAEQKAVERFRDFRRLEDRRLVQDLVDRERDLWPPHPAQQAGMERWLADAGDVLGRLPSHREALAALRRSGRSAVAREAGIDPAIDRLLHCVWVRDAASAELLGMGDTGSRRAHLTEIVTSATGEIVRLEQAAESRPVWRFDRVEDQWLHDNLAELVGRLEALGAPSEQGCTVASVRARLAIALGLERRTLVEPAAAWREAVAAIANVETDPRYGGLRIDPVLGLVPLGRDPKSHLWEFAHVLSGSVPVRDAAGNLVIDEDSAIVLVLIPRGSTRIGARTPFDQDEPPEEHVDPLARPQEQPVHEVALDPFFISKHEMTQGQWLRATGSNPSHARPDRAWEHGYRPNLRHPVEQVSFEDCVDVLGRHGLEIPTEAQWEYAARAGTTTPWWPGAAIGSFAAAENLADRSYDAIEQAGHPFDADRTDGWSGPAPVGTWAANPFGLHDVIGNVSEWCRDRIAFYKVPALPGDGLRAGGIADARAVRGGAYNTLARNSRSASRIGMFETSRHQWIGVRPSLRVAVR